MRSLLITGGTGYFARAMAKRALEEGVQRVCIFSRGEAQQAAMRAEFEDHPLRNTLLDKIGAEFKHCRSYDFTKVEPGRPLANDTYNTLEGVYAGNLYQWRVPASTRTTA